jgi:pyruvate kinase
MRKTKIVITIGPSTATLDMIKTLILEGVNVFRLNFSHGDHKTHESSISMIREASKTLNKEVAILQDISGPKVRIGEIDGELKLFKDDIIILSKTKDKNAPKTLDISYPDIIDMVSESEEVFFADGTIRTKVIKKDSQSLHLKLLNDGSLSSHKGVNFPHTKIDISAITKKDEADLAFGSKNDIDIVALSFVQSKEDILKAKSIMEKHNFNPMVISKIETAEALNNLEDILDVSDGVMVARGDLGAEFGVTKLPRIQKEIISKANAANKPTITATQMLTSMKENPFPTRAEVSDIANAVYDGTDAVMLSDETTIGLFPIEAVKVLHDTIKDVEVDYPYEKDFQPKSSSDAIAKAAVGLSANLKKEALVAFTISGFSAQAISRYRPKEKIYAVSHSLKTHRRLSLVWGVHPLFTMQEINNPSKLLNAFIKKLIEEKKLDKNRQYVVTMGDAGGKKGATNIIRLLDQDAIDMVLSYDL